MLVQDTPNQTHKNWKADQLPPPPPPPLYKHIVKHISSQLIYFTSIGAKILSMNQLASQIDGPDKGNNNNTCESREVILIL